MRRHRLRRRILIGVSIVVVVWAIVAAWLLGTAWRRLPLHEPAPAVSGPIMDNAEYALVIDTHARPYAYIIENSDGDGVVQIFGAEHTMDAGDAQLADIRVRWNAMAPTIALIEGRQGMLFPAFMDPVQTFGEGGFVRALALDSGARAMSWEPPVDVLIESVKAQEFTSEQIALRLMLNPYFSNLRHGKPSDPESFVLDTLNERSKWPGIDGAISSMDELNSAWLRSFPDGPDWRDVSDEYGLPGFLGAMDLNRARDEHLVRCVVDLAGQGERVFVICGSSHAVKVRGAIESALSP